MDINRIIASYLSQDYKLMEYNDDFVSFQKPNSTDIIIISLFEEIVKK